MQWWEIALYAFIGAYSIGVTIYFAIKIKRGKK